MADTPAYQEIVDFIASTNPVSVSAFQPSESSKERVALLINQEKTGGLSDAERDELDHYLQLEHLMRLAKAKARLLMNE